MDRIINKGIVIIAILTVVPVVSADYTDSLKWVSSNATDCGDWSQIHNPVTDELRRHGFGLDRDRSSGSERRRLWRPSTHGLPSDIGFVLGPDLDATGRIVEWVYVYPLGFARTIFFDGEFYTDNATQVCCSFGWVRTPYYNPNSDMDNNLDNITKVTTYNHRNGTILINTTFTIEAHRSFKKGKKRYSTGYVHVNKRIDDVAIWQKPSASVSATITNCSGKVYLLEVPPPGGVTGIRITTDSGTYEKHAYYMTWNVSNRGLEYFDLKPYDYEEFSGLAPVGVNLYASSEPITDVAVMLWNPFERVDANVTVILAEEEKVDKWEVSAVFLSVCLITLILYFFVKRVIE